MACCICEDPSTRQCGWCGEWLCKLGSCLAIHQTKHSGREIVMYARKDG